MSNGYTRIVRDGLWDQNPALVQILGLCPLLAVSNTVVNGIGLGLATLLTLAASNGAIALIRRLVRPEIRIPVFVVLIASIVTTIELLMKAYLTELHHVLGIFIPLIVTNCIVLGRAEAFAARNPLPHALADGLTMGLGFTLALVALGALREVLGSGTLFAQAGALFGPGASGLSVTLFHDYPGFLVAVLPPGAFIGLGLLIAAKNVIDARLARRAAAPAAVPETTTQ
jgi:electron transport complex protein RnfE